MDKMENLNIFELMSEEEAEMFKPETKKPQLTGALASKVQHEKEKMLQGNYAKGWEEAMGKDDPGETSQTAKKSTSSKKVAVEKTAEYLSFRKLFCYAGKQHLIDDPTMTMEAIRRKFEKVYPELSKERTEMVYQPPKLSKEEKVKTDIPPLAKTEQEEQAKDINEELLCEQESSTPEEKLNCEQEGSTPEEEIKLLPAMVNGQERFGLVIPILKGAKKGALCELEKTFTNWEDLLEEPAARNLLIADNGLYEVRVEDVAILTVKLEEQCNPNAEKAIEGFQLKVPKIPYELLLEAVGLFKELAERDTPLEAMVRFYYDGKSHFMWVPHQVVGPTTVDAIDSDQDQLLEKQHIRVLEMHSHNVMSAFFSTRDDADEVATGFYAVAGNVTGVPQIMARYSCGGHYRNIRFADLFDMPPFDMPPGMLFKLPKNVLEKWVDKISIREDDDGGKTTSI